MAMFPKGRVGQDMDPRTAYFKQPRSYTHVHMLRLTLIPQESSSLPLEFIFFDRAAFGFSSPNAGISWRFSSHSSPSNENGATVSFGHCIAIYFAVY